VSICDTKAVAKRDTPIRRKTPFPVLLSPDPDGYYTDLVRWRSSADAHGAMTAMQGSEIAMAFMARIDPAAVQMSHLPVVLKDGTYTDCYIGFDGEGEPGTPLVLRAETPGGVTLDCCALCSGKANTSAVTTSDRPDLR
jgi:Chondroitinase B